MTNQTRLQKLQTDFENHERESEKEELAVAIKNEHHERRIERAKKIVTKQRSKKSF